MSCQPGVLCTDSGHALILPLVESSLLTEPSKADGRTLSCVHRERPPPRDGRRSRHGQEHNAAVSAGPGSRADTLRGGRGRPPGPIRFPVMRGR